MKKLFIFISVLFLLIYFVWSRQAWFKADVFRVSFLNVGQGDATLIVTPTGQTILIDGGPDKRVLRELSTVLPFWYRQIDLLVITHAHDDHVFGLIEVIQRFRVKNILYNNLNFKTPVLDSLIKTIKEQRNKAIKVQGGEVFDFKNGCSVNILAAASEPQKNDNDYSIVSMFSCLGKKILFSGDAGETIEKKLLSTNYNLEADIFKVSHHGSSSANSHNFLAAVNPQAAVISVGINNKFGHPTTLILERLRQLPVDIYRTDKQGTINFLANNKSIILKK